MCVGSVNEKMLVQKMLDGESLSRLRRKVVRKNMGKPLPSVEITSNFEVVMNLLKNNTALLVKNGGVVKGIISRSDVL